MSSIHCSQCEDLLQNPAEVSRHKNRYHSIPIAANLPDGTSRQVVALRRGYRCWCDLVILTRGACIKHVRKDHDLGDDIAIFQSSGQLL